MGSIGSSMSPSARMTAASGIARQLATWPSCARSPSTSWGGTEHPGSACGRVASRPPGTMITCSLFWLADFMRRPWHAGGFGIVQAIVLVAVAEREDRTPDDAHPGDGVGV